MEDSPIMTNLIEEKLRFRKKNKSWLAHKSGLTRSHLSRIANGHIEPGLRAARKIAVALDCCIEDVFII
jgi:DNA-binding XRE family transcriptional regulator